MKVLAASPDAFRGYGLRDWDGCEACGGDGARRGRGFVCAPTPGEVPNEHEPT